MAALPVIADVFRVTMNTGYASGTPAITAHNVMHFYCPGKTKAQLAAALIAGWQANQTQWLSNTSQVKSWDIIKLTGSDLTQNYVQTGGIIGANASDPILAYCCLINVKTALGGRRNRGRIYLPWVCEGRQVGGILDGTYQAQLQTAWAAWAAALTAAGYQFGVASYVAGNWHAYTSITVRSILAVQRRRQDALR